MAIHSSNHHAVLRRWLASGAHLPWQMADRLRYVMLRYITPLSHCARRICALDGKPHPHPAPITHAQERLLFPDAADAPRCHLITVIRRDPSAQTSQVPAGQSGRLSERAIPVWAVQGRLLCAAIQIQRGGQRSSARCRCAALACALEPVQLPRTPPACRECGRQRRANRWATLGSC